MNKENLRKFRDHLSGVPDERYDQKLIRNIGDGCALSHCFGFDTFGLEMYDDQGVARYLNKDHTWPLLTKWVKDAYGIDPFGPVWNYLFDHHPKSREEVISRIDDMLKDC